MNEKQLVIVALVLAGLGVAGWIGYNAFMAEVEKRAKEGAEESVLGGFAEFGNTIGKAVQDIWNWSKAQ